MIRLGMSFLFAVVVVVALARTASAVERNEVPGKLKWDLTALYPSESAWESAKASLIKRSPEMAKFQGHLGDSPQALLNALESIMNVDRDMTQLYNYSSMLADEDQRISRHIGMRESAQQLYVQFGTTVAYVRPEILALGADKVHSFIAQEPKLKPYTMYLENILRFAPHTLTSPEERIAARAGSMSDAGESIRTLFRSAEMPFPEVTLSTGEKVRIDDQGYTRYRALPNREDRIKVFRAFWQKHHEFQGTLAAALNAQVQAHIFDKDVHKYGSSLEAAMFRDDIPTKVYTQLIADVNSNLPTLFRYLKLRKRMMGVDTLRYEDLYAPIVKNVELKYTPEQAMSVVLEAVSPLGKDYVSTLGKGYTGGWVDWMPTTGKKSGAYSTGAYGLHPYQLMNFTGIYEEVSTLAHESGHSMHTYLADTHQPYVTHDYATFVAEVASTLNENLLLHHMLDITKDRDTRLFLLGSYLDNLRGTLFRQVMFAEFELKIHEMAEKGETLTGENLSKLYLEIVRKYYGHAQNVCRVDDLYSSEWAYIDHFFYNFYVYQYATSIVASTALANGIRHDLALPAHPTAHRDLYLAMLESGSSKYPIQLLKDAGVDMTTSAPFKAAMKEMNSVMDEIEATLRQPSSSKASATPRPRTTTVRKK